MKYFLMIFVCMMLAWTAAAAPVPQMEMRDSVTRDRLAAAPGRTVDGISWDWKKSVREGADLYDITIKVDVKEDRGIIFTAGIPFAKAGAEFLRSPYVSEKITREQIYTENFYDNVTGGPEGCFSRYPVNAVAHGKKGLALAVDTELPIKQRIEYDAENQRFNIHFDFAATSMQKEIRFRFAVYVFLFQK